MGRKRAYWGEENGVPHGSWVNTDREWEDPTFDAIILEEEITPSIPLHLLTPKQRFVIECLFGMGRPQLTEREVAELMAISQPSVHGIKERALAKLKRGLSECP